MAREAKHSDEWFHIRFLRNIGSPRYTEVVTKWMNGHQELREKLELDEDKR